MHSIKQWLNSMFIQIYSLHFQVVVMLGVALGNLYTLPYLGNDNDYKKR